MTAFTVVIEVANADRTIWQAIEPAENHHGAGFETARNVAEITAHHQDVADGDGWRVRVWDGADADTGTSEAYVWDKADQVTMTELTRFLGLPDDQMEAVVSFLGDTYGSTVSQAEAKEIKEIWDNEPAPAGPAG